MRLRADAGVALAFVPPLPSTHVSGVARFLHGRPLIQLSLLGKRNDVFWFSFFHKVAHVLKHPMRAIFLDDAAAGDTVESPEEQEATEIEAFAAEIGVHPAIVVGQLQHRDLLPRAHALTRPTTGYDHLG